MHPVQPYSKLVIEGRYHLGRPSDRDRNHGYDTGLEHARRTFLLRLKLLLFKRICGKLSQLLDSELNDNSI